MIPPGPRFPGERAKPLERDKIHERQSLTPVAVHDVLLREGHDELERHWTALAISAMAASSSLGARFGVDEAARAAALVGHRLEVAAGSPYVVGKDGAIHLNGTTFSLKAPAGAYAAARRAAGFPQAVEDVAAVEWHHSLVRFGASEVNERFRRGTGRRMTADHWLGWMAVKVIADAALRARDGEPLERAVQRMRFDGHKGVALRFDAARRLPQPLYVVNLTKDTVLWQG